MAGKNKKMVIKNFENLATSVPRRQALLIAEAGLEAVNTKKVVFNFVNFNAKKNLLTIQGKKFNLSEFKNVFLIGFGKASIEAASALYDVMGERITKGFIIGLEEKFISQNILAKAGTHPLPSEKNIGLTRELLENLEGMTEKDLVISLISGGGSALFTKPFHLTAEEEALIFKALTKKGASILELNTVRKHTDLVKGGNLAKLIYPATSINILFSDIPGDDLSQIASGPTVKDLTASRDAMGIIEKYKILESCLLKKIDLAETPKEQKYFKNVNNFLAVSPKHALIAMREKCEELGFKTKIFSESFQGEARVLGPEILEELEPKTCLLGAGESTVQILGKGKGGRNQEMALAALPKVKESQVLICLASDGRDNTDAAGAVIDSSTLFRANKFSLDPMDFLQNNNSYHFFEATGDLIFTGLTNSNVSDLVIGLKN